MADSIKLDEIDRKIIDLTVENARLPFQDVARECGISGPAIHQRFQRLVSDGVIKGSQYVIDTNKVGYQTCAFLGVVLNDLSYVPSVIDSMKQIPEIVECHYVTGKYALLIKVYAKDNKDLLHIILDKIATIPGVLTTETFQVSLDEIFSRQLKL